jgi:hypothetical protein
VFVDSAWPSSLGTTKVGMGISMFTTRLSVGIQISKYETDSGSFESMLKFWYKAFFEYGRFDSQFWIGCLGYAGKLF